MNMRIICANNFRGEKPSNSSGESVFAAPSREAQLPLRAFVACAEGSSERHRVATRRRSEDLQRKPPRLRCTGADGTADAHHIGSKAVPVLLGSKAVIKFEGGGTWLNCWN